MKKDVSEQQGCCMLWRLSKDDIGTTLAVKFLLFEAIKKFRTTA